MDDLLDDKRFAYIARDPKFKRIPQAERKVKIDKRFQSMFKDKKFTVQYTIDKRGRPINETSSENLRKYYDLSSSEEEEEEEEEKEEEQKKPKQQKKKKSKGLKKGNEDSDSSDNCFSSNGELLRIKPKDEHNANSEEQSKSESESESESDIDDAKIAENLKADLKESKKQLNIRRKNESDKLPHKIKEKLKDMSVNYARGEGVLLSDSSSDEESSEALDEEEEIDHKWGELDKGAETTDEITSRLALCNMDWDRIRSVDLMVLFNSFLPPGGFIRSITIYPSEFGLQRMKEEESQGPKELKKDNMEGEIEDESDGQEGSSYHMEKLRQYQLNRLKYYYAVVEFNSAETANKVYTECDGTEYESTATKLDLRFIPDDMEFDQTPKEVCNELPELTKYQPRLFTTTALQQAKVELTWDETNPERMEIAQKLNSGKLDEINKNDLQAYLATDSSDNESAEEKESQEDNSDSGKETNADPVEKYKALLKEIEEKEESKQKKDVELEFTWGLDAKEKAEKLVQERLKKDENLTPFEQYLEKRKAKKKAKREERKKRNDAGKDALNSDGSEMLDSDDDSEIGHRKSSRKKKDNDSMKNGSTVSLDEEDEERRKAELELLLMDENDDGKQHFNMKKIEENATMSKSKQKRLNKKKNGQEQMVEDKFEVNVQDPRFNALFTSHHFNIDPADPRYRKTKGTEALIKEKLKRRGDNDISEEIPAKEAKMKPNAELQALIKSVKKNSKNISRPIK